MSSPRNEHTFAQEFYGNLRGAIEPVPARIKTTLRVMNQETAREVQKYALPNSPPLYAFGKGWDLPLHPSLEATGRHYFTW
jgi:hypothetical protein